MESLNFRVLTLVIENKSQTYYFKIVVRIFILFFALLKLASKRTYLSYP